MASMASATATTAGKKEQEDTTSHATLRALVERAPEFAKVVAELRHRLQGRHGLAEE